MPLLAGLLLLITVPASGSFGSPRVVSPYTNASPSEKFVCEVDPTDIYGRGEGNYRLLQNGSVLWEGAKPFTLVQCAVTDEGVVAGFGYSYGEEGFSERGSKAGAGDFSVAIIEPTGRLRLHERVSRQESRFLHDIPNPAARGMILDGPTDRFVVRVRDSDINRSRETWWVYEITSGKKVGIFELSAPDGGPASPIKAVPIAGTPLILVHYWRYEHPDTNARFALLDPAFNEIWSITWRRDYNVDGDESARDQLWHKIRTEGAILDTSKSNRFTLFSSRSSEEVSFLVQSDTHENRKWVVTELERRKRLSVPERVEESLPSKQAPLKFLGSFSLEVAQTTNSELFQNLIGFGFDGAGKIGLLRRGKDEDYRIALVQPNGTVIQETALPGPTRPGLARKVKFAWANNDQWIVTSSDLGSEGKTSAWWLDALAGKLEPLSGFMAPAIESLVGTPDGGFVALCMHRFKYTIEEELIGFDHMGKVRWRVKQDYRNDQALFSPEDVTLTAGGQLAVLDNIRGCIQYFDLEGAFIKSTSLEKAWGRKPNYPIELSPEPDGGVLVHDFQGSPPVVRMNAAGEVVSQISLKHGDGRPIDLTYGVRLSPTGRLWTCDGASLVRVTEEGVADLVLGTKPGGATLGRIGCLNVDQNGQIYAADERSGEVHVFDQTGRRLRVCVPLSSDFSRKLTTGNIAINQQGEIFLSNAISDFDKLTYVHFGADGKRIGLKKFGLDTIKEQWFPLSTEGQILVLGYHDAFLVGADGKVQKKIQRRPDGMWLEHPDLACVAPDGTFAIVSGGALRGTRFFVNLYSADGAPIRTVVLPDNCMPYCFAYTGKYLATCTESAICLFDPLGAPVLSFEYPLEKLKEHWWTCYSTKSGSELWMVSRALKKVCRFELP